MTSYLVNHQKAKRVFAKRETELLHAIKNDYTRAKIVRAAERVREAKIKVFKAVFSQHSVLPASAYEPDEKAKRWLSRPVEEIIEEYGTTA